MNSYTILRNDGNTLFKKSNKKKTLPYLTYCLCSFFLAIGGLGVSIYLSVSHYRVYTDIAYSSFCALSKAINCDTVSQSPYSILWGIPVPVWGVVGYAFLLLLIPFACRNTTERKNLWSLIFAIVLCYSTYSIYLAYLSTFKIHSYCLMCIVTYGINFALVFISWIVIRRFNNGRILKGFIEDIVFTKKKAKKIVPLLITFSFFIGILLYSFNDYWNLDVTDEISDLPSGTTEEGHPWIGAENPEITIIEYNDYLCFQCKKMHFFLRSLVAENPEKIRIVHMQFPIDIKYNMSIKEDLHPGSGEMAMLAIYAGVKGKFWEMNDLLFQVDHSEGEINLKEVAEEIGINANELVWALGKKELRLMLKREIAFGIKAEVKGTPSFVIGGETFEGNIPPELLTNVIGR